MKKYFLCAILTVLGLTSGTINAQPLNILTEEFPPYNFTEAKEVKGVSTEIVEAVLKKVNIDFTIKSYPWARTYKIAQENPNTLIYSISRRKNREKLFKWIGIITPSKNAVFAMKSKGIVIKSYEDLKKYRIGTNISDATESHLVEEGIDINALARLSGKNVHLRNYKMLKAGRIDLWPLASAVAFNVSKASGDDPNKLLEEVFELTAISKGGYYIAASLSTPDDVVEKIRKSLEEFKKTNEYKEILAKWGL